MLSFILFGVQFMLSFSQLYSFHCYLFPIVFCLETDLRTPFYVHLHFIQHFVYQMNSMQ